MQGWNRLGRGVRVTLALTLVVGLAGIASAGTLTGESSTNAGSTCSGGNDGNGFCSNAVTQVFGTTTFQSRYEWNVNADTTVLSTRDESGTATHTLSFSATSPGDYRLTVSQSRVGALNRCGDAS